MGEPEQRARLLRACCSRIRGGTCSPARLDPRARRRVSLTLSCSRGSFVLLRNVVFVVTCGVSVFVFESVLTYCAEPRDAEG